MAFMLSHKLYVVCVASYDGTFSIPGGHLLATEQLVAGRIGSNLVLVPSGMKTAPSQNASDEN